MGNLLKVMGIVLFAVLSVTTRVGLSNAAVPPVFYSLGRVTEGLASPGAIAVDGTGKLYVADARQGGIHKYDAYGNRKAHFNQVLVSGRGLAVTPDGKFLYASTSYGVARIDAMTGDLLDRIGGQDSSVPVGFSGPLAIDAEGAVYVADLLSFEILVFTESGGFRQRIGGKGTGPGKFASIDTVAIVGDRLLVADSSAANLKVDVFSLDGDYVISLPTGNGFGPLPLHVPRGIVGDDQGRLYFLEFVNSDIRFLDSGTYAYLGTFGRTGKSVGELAYVKALAYDPVNRRLFVSCDGARVEIYGVDGGTTPAFVNHAPSAPVPLSPVGGSVAATVTPLLSYTTATDSDSDAVHYQVKVLSGDEVLFSAETIATSVTVGAELLVENAPYTWSVQAFDSEGAGSTVNEGSFVVNAVNEPPTTPVLTAPLNGEILAGAGVLSWQAAVDPDPVATQISYQVEVSPDSGFSPVTASGNVSGTTMTLDELANYAALEDGRAYFWRVAAIDGEGNISVPGQHGQFIYDTALLRVTANMPGANVYLSGNHGFAGRYVGTAPVELRDLPAGTCSVVVERAGFEPYVTQVAVSGTDNAVIYAPLRLAWQPQNLQLVNNGINGRSGLSIGNENAAAPFLVDFDNDGRLDLLAGGANGNLTLFPAMELTSRGQLNFQTGKDLDLPVLPGAVPFVADWNNDGRKDLLIGLADGTVKLFLNVGEEAVPAFGAGQDLIVAGNSLHVGGKSAPVVVDLDADGDKDLVVGNAAGQVLAFFNQGTDTSVQLVSPVLLARFDGTAVPASIDWDADGQRDLLISVNGELVPLYNDLDATGTFIAGAALPAGGVNAVFPLDIDGAKGKDLIVGQANGKLAYWAGNSSALTAVGQDGLLFKVDEVETLISAVAPALLAEVDKIRKQITNGSLGGATKTASALAVNLPLGDARNVTEELAALCR